MALSSDEVLKIARLARLRLSSEQVEIERTRLSSLLGYMERLQSVDLSGVEPMSHPAQPAGARQGPANRLRPDVPEHGLGIDAFKAIAPETFDDYLVIPKVIDAGGGA